MSSTELRRPGTRSRVPERLLVPLGLALLAVCLVIDWRLVFAPGADGHLGDLRVYVDGTRWWRDGRDLYDYRTGNGLGFTYPPIAAVVFLPLAATDLAVVERVWTVLNLAFAVLLAGLLVRRVHGARSVAAQLVLVAAASALLLQSIPVQANLVNGQVSLLLTLLVLYDAAWLRERSRFGGVLVGVATAVKLTPGLFVVHDLVDRRWGRVVGALAGFGTLTLVGLVLLPADSMTYWGGTFAKTPRVGQFRYAGNHAVRGALARLGLDGAGATAVWLVVSIAVVALAVRTARIHERDDRPLLAASVVGCATVLASPISWPHHEVWLSVAGLLLVACSRTPGRVFGATTLLGYVFWGPLTDLATSASPAALHLLTELPLLACLTVCVVPFGQRRPEADHPGW